MSDIAAKFTTGARWTLGLIFTVFGLNAFLNFLPTPPPPSEAAGAFIGALVASGYMFPLIKVTEITAGALLLANRWTPLALVVLAPIVVNIVFYHLFLAPAGSALALAVLGLELYLAWSYRDAFRSLLTPRAAPRRSTADRTSVAHAT